MEFTLTYELAGSGWADAQIRDGGRTVDVTVSYLCDSLKELGEAACALSAGAEQARVVFMGEPGEMQLYLRRTGSDIAYELRWYDDWNSWGMVPDDKYELALSGTTTVSGFVGEVYAQLCRLHGQYGEKEYKRQWIEHDFPTEILAELAETVRAKPFGGALGYSPPLTATSKEE
jgi:hypothetical protein